MKFCYWGKIDRYKKKKDIVSPIFTRNLFALHFYIFFFIYTSTSYPRFKNISNNEITIDARYITRFPVRNRVWWRWNWLHVPDFWWIKVSIDFSQLVKFPFESQVGMADNNFLTGINKWNRNGIKFHEWRYSMIRPLSSLKKWKKRLQRCIPRHVL